MAFIPYPEDFAERVRKESHTLEVAGVYTHSLEQVLSGIESPHSNLKDMLEQAMNPASYGVGPSRILSVINGAQDPEAVRVVGDCARIEDLYSEMLVIQEARGNDPFANMIESI